MTLRAKVSDQIESVNAATAHFQNQIHRTVRLDTTRKIQSLESAAYALCSELCDLIITLQLVARSMDNDVLTLQERLDNLAQRLSQISATDKDAVLRVTSATKRLIDDAIADGDHSQARKANKLLAHCLQKGKL